MENSLVKKQRIHLLDLLASAKREYFYNKAKQNWEKAATFSNLHGHIKKELHKLNAFDKNDIAKHPRLTP
jgi:hypothetical protein